MMEKGREWREEKEVGEIGSVFNNRENDFPYSIYVVAIIFI